MKYTVRTVLSLAFSSTIAWFLGVGSAWALNAPTNPNRHPVQLMAQADHGATEAPTEEEHGSQQTNEEKQEHKGREEERRGMEEERRGVEEERRGAEEERRGMEEQEKGMQEEEKGIEEEDSSD